jgi:hypothetical protein
VFVNRDLSFNLLARRTRRNMEHRQRSPPGMGKWLLRKKQRRTDVRLNPACEAEALFRTRTGDPLLTMEDSSCRRGPRNSACYGVFLQLRRFVCRRAGAPPSKSLESP